MCDPSDALRQVLKRLNEAGISYSRIARLTDAEFEWKSNAIRQLLRRDGVIRATPRIAALVKAVSGPEFRSMLTGKDVEDALQALSFFMSDVSLEATTKETSGKIGARFQKIRKASAGFDYPERQAFIRFDWAGKRLITVLVDSKYGSDGYIFSMKITGRTNNRRIVIGDILSTVKNTYYSGLAYQVNEKINASEFFDLNAFDFSEIERHTGKNEIGLECFTIDNSHLHLKEIPVPFHGLDGRGSPISGIGILIRQSVFSKYRISEASFSSVECGKDNEGLLGLMESVNGKTLHNPKDFGL